MVISEFSAYWPLDVPMPIIWNDVYVTLRHDPDRVSHKVYINCIPFGDGLAGIEHQSTGISDEYYISEAILYSQEYIEDAVLTDLIPTLERHSEEPILPEQFNGTYVGQPKAYLEV